ncbi:gluconokinase [Aquamicrobium sp. LC103]|nr:gluconokinase [Aquamicrobium sp. LC103]
MGVSGCGKSTVGERLADRLDCPFVEGDGLHPAANVRKMEAGMPLDDADRWPWLDLLGRRLGEEGRVVISCSALKRSYRDRLRNLAGRPVTFVFLRGTRALIAARMQERRGHYMPPSLLDSQLATLEPPMAERDVVTIEIDQPLETIVGLAMTNLAERARAAPKSSSSQGSA